VTRALLWVALAERDFGSQIMDAMGQGLFISDSHGRLELVNARLAQTLGGEAQQLVGRDLLSLVASADHDLVRCQGVLCAAERHECDVRLIAAGALPVHAHASDAETLIRRADEAMYEAKRRGLGLVVAGADEAPPERRDPPTLAA
jgi:PAS domain-containing protein